METSSAFVCYACTTSQARENQNAIKCDAHLEKKSQIQCMHSFEKMNCPLALCMTVGTQTHYNNVIKEHKTASLTGQFTANLRCNKYTCTLLSAEGREIISNK